MLGLERRCGSPRCDLARQRGAFPIDGGFELTSGSPSNEELHLEVGANHAQRPVQKLRIAGTLGLIERSIPRIKAHGRDPYFSPQNSAMAQAFLLVTDVSWSLLHRRFYDTLSGG